MVYALVLGTSFFTELGVRVSPAAPRKIRFARSGAQHEKMNKIIIKKEQAGIRIDKFLKVEFFLPRKTTSRGEYSRGEIITKIKNGEVAVNSKKVKPSYILKEKDVLQIKNFSESKESKLIPNNEIKLKIIFEDENVIAINKPAGIQVHPSHNEKTKTIANALIKYFPKIQNVHDESQETLFCVPALCIVWTRILRAFWQLLKIKKPLMN